MKHSGHLALGIKEKEQIRDCLKSCENLLNPKLDIEKIGKYATIVSINQIPEIPAVVGQLKQALMQKFPNIIEIVKIIESNSVVAGDVIGTLNSPTFQKTLSKPVTVKTVKQALQMVGVDKIFSIVVSSALKTTCAKNDTVQEIINHSALVAMACAEIAGYTGLIEVSDAYLYGLFMHGGMIMTSNQYPDIYKDIFNLYKTMPVPALEKEVLKIGIEHNYLGVLISRKWGITHLNEEILFAIQEQENKNFGCIENDKIRTYIAIGMLANIYVNEITENIYISSDFNDRNDLSKKVLNFNEKAYKNIRTVLIDTLPKYKLMQDQKRRS